MKYQSIHETTEGGGEGAREGGRAGGRAGAHEGAHAVETHRQPGHRQLPQRGGCNRCDAPQGRMVTLNKHETVCGACIGRMANMQAATARVEMDRTPAIECGFLHEGAPC